MNLPEIKKIINRHMLSDQVINKIIMENTAMKKTIIKHFAIPYITIGAINYRKETNEVVILSFSGKELEYISSRKEDCSEEHLGFIYEAILCLHTEWLELQKEGS